MKKLLNRKEALGMIDAIFTSLHFNLISIKDLGIENSKERDYFLTEAWKIDQGRLKKDYEQTVNSLDAIGFKEYYKLIGKFATKYKIGCWKEYNEYEPILIEELNEELRKYDKTEDKLELINSFTVDELQSESFIFDSKVQVLYDILDDFNVGNKKEEGINTVLESFNSSDKASFIGKLQTDKNLLNALIDKVNGNEKNQLLTYLYKFLSSADGFGAEEYKLPPKAGFDAKYKKGKVIISTYYYIDRKISRYKYRYIEKNRELNPFTNVTFCYGNDQNEITVPAIVLVKSRGDVVLYDDFYKSNIDWKSLTEEKKRELYTEFVLHYLPKELGDAAVGNPITFLIMIIVGAVIAKASAVIAACASLIGTGFSAVNIIEGCKMITKVAEGYDSISDVNAAKVSAKDCARGIALLGVEIIPVLFGLIKRGFAKYNGKEIKVGENARARTQNELADIVGKNINDVGSIEGYEKFTRKDGTIGLRRQKRMTGQLDQLSVDENGIIHNVDAEKISKSSNVGKNTKNSIQLRTLSEPSSKELRKNLIATGVKEPDFPNAAHHIVAGKAPNAAHHIVAVGADEAKQSERLLEKYGINLNSPSNGVFLPYKKNEFVTTEAMHCGGHLDSYHINVRERILNRVNAARKLGYSNSQIQKLICAELQKIRTELLKGTLKIHN